MNDLINETSKLSIDKGAKYNVENFIQNAEMLEWAGVSFGEEDTYKISKAINRLAVMSGAQRLAFFGKIFGTQKDYWIICGGLQGAEETAKDPQIEKRGEGVNQLVFWVTDNLLNDWI